MSHDSSITQMYSLQVPEDNAVVLVMTMTFCLLKT